MLNANLRPDAAAPPLAGIVKEKPPRHPVAGNSGTAQCPVCGSSRSHAFSATLLRKHQVSYYRCPRCGLLQTEEPYWLDEAYSDAIAISDTGLIRRNLSIAAKLAALLYFERDAEGAYLDVAGGYGMLTRLMRDFGFDFYWSDKYCQNLLARGFEADKANAPFKALTAFEVLEHVHDPLAFIAEVMESYGSRTLVFSTELYGDTPPADDWWYYAFDTGQHISFYQAQTMLCIAERLGLKFHSAHGIHMLTDQPVNMRRFNLLTGRLAYPLALYVKYRMPSRTLPDHYALANTDRSIINQ